MVRWRTSVWEYSAMTKRVGLAQARKAAGYTQESFAEALGVDRSTVARWEAGDHEPSPYLWPKITRLLGVSRDELKEAYSRVAPEVERDNG
jgi:transcriptional regulator with XRE-family HTH domain